MRILLFLVMTSTAVTTAAAVCTMSAACHQFKEMPKAEEDATKHQIEEGGNLSGFDFANRRVIDLRNEWYLTASVYRGTPP